MTTPAINFQLPPDFHPTTLKSDNATLRDAMTSAYDTWSKVKNTLSELEAHAKKDRPIVPKRKLTPTDQARLDAWSVRTSSHNAEFARKSQPLIERAGTNLDKTLGRVREQRRQLAEQLDKELCPTSPTLPQHAEVRQVVREMAGDKRAFDVVMNAVQHGDRAVAAAVVSAPAITSGLTTDEQTKVRDFAARKWFPDRVAALASLDGDIARVERMRDSFLEDMTTTISGLVDHEARIIAEGLK